MSKASNNHIRYRFIWLIYIISLVIVVLLAFISFSVGKKILFTKLQDKLDVVVSVWSLTIDTSLVEKYKNLASQPLTQKDILSIEKQEDYKKLFQQINTLKKSQADTLQCAYILIPWIQKSSVQFLIDCDVYEDRKNNSSQAIAHIWFQYDITQQKAAQEALFQQKKSISDTLVYDSEWGVHSLMWFHPLYNNKWEFLWVLGVDISDQKYFSEVKQLSRFVIILSCLFAIGLLFLSYYISHMFLQISDLTNIQSNLKKSYNQLKQLDDKKTEFLNITSHELRTPITSINWYLSMILDWDMWEINNDVKTYLKKVYGSSRRLSNLVNDMLDVAKMESGKMEYLHESFSINKVISEVVFDFEVQLQTKAQKFILHIENTQDLLIISDKNKVRQCIINLVSNAHKYNKPNGTITLKTSVINNQFLLEVIDTWIWISQEHLDVIFEKFWQIKNSLTRDIDGTGLGLSIVKWFVEKLWWKITVESTLWVGSTFWLYLPLE